MAVQASTPPQSCACKESGYNSLMSEPKTKATKESVKEFLSKVEPEEKRQDSLVLLDMFQKLTGEKAVMWGESIVGFGQYHYKSERSRQEGDWFLVGFSPRKQNFCLYINKLSDVDQEVLRKLIENSFRFMKNANPA